METLDDTSIAYVANYFQVLSEPMPRAAESLQLLKAGSTEDRQKSSACLKRSGSSFSQVDRTQVPGAACSPRCIRAPATRLPKRVRRKSPRWHRGSRELPLAGMHGHLAVPGGGQDAATDSRSAIRDRPTNPGMVSMAGSTSRSTWRGRCPGGCDRAGPEQSLSART